MKVGNIDLDLSEPVVMTILNVTPDSFFAGSRLETETDIARAADRAVADGAAIIDLGGYSSRPGADDVSPEEEYRRLARGMKIIRDKHPGVAVSIDTFRGSVARRIIEEFGPCMINDISAGGLDDEMIPTAAELNVPYIAMHMRANPATMQQHTDYDDIVANVVEYFENKTAELHKAGIEDIIIDPGFGFAKTTRQNHRLLGGLDALSRLGYPVLSGVSRKSMIYKVLECTPAESLAGTAVMNWESLRGGAVILRVHDTREASDIVKLYKYYTESQ